MSPSGTISLVTIYSSDRRFEVWGWGVGHRGLLLRSNPPSDGQPRIEVLFKPAYAVGLSVLLDGVQITESGSDALPDEVRMVHGGDLREWEHLYRIVSGTGSGWVIGGSVSGRQDHEKDFAPTMFDGWAPREGVVELFSRYGSAKS
jgi:hypothetical protein